MGLEIVYHLMSFKKLLLTLLVPIIRPIEKIRLASARLWAHALLSTYTPLDSSVVILGQAEIHGTAQFKLGKNLYLYRELYLETQEKGEIEIGNNVVISRGTHLVSFGKIVIGNNTMIGEYCSIRDANHVFDGQQPLRNAGHSSAAIHIGENVWIGRGVTILAGVQIGDNAIIAANAVVTKNIPAQTLAGGIPAQPIKKISV